MLSSGDLGSNFLSGQNIILPKIKYARKEHELRRGASLNGCLN